MATTTRSTATDTAGNTFVFLNSPHESRPVSVILNGKPVGKMQFSVKDGWRYLPGGKAGDWFTSYEACERSITGEDEPPTLTQELSSVPARAVHTDLIRKAREVAKGCEQTDDGQKCFNLHVFLERMERAAIGYVDSKDAPNRGFRLSADEIARYLWVCLACEAGDAPDGFYFRGMPILD